MRTIRFRCSSIGKLMTEPKTQKEGPLSVGAKTYIRELAAQEIFGVEFEVSSKYMEKGIVVENESINLLNRVRGLELAKNTERRANEWITGECDLFDVATRRGHDLKSAWSIATFPICEKDCEDGLYEWQMRGYMALWDAEEWEVNYALIDTPENLIGYEPLPLHVVGHIPENMRLTTWTVKRDREKEAAIFEKVKHAREYYAEVIAEFDRTHRDLRLEIDQTHQTLMGQIEREQAAQPMQEAPAGYPPVTNAAAPVVTPIRQAAADTGATLRLGQINERLAPIALTAEGLAGLGFQPVATEKAAKLYRAGDLPRICAALIAHLERAAMPLAA